MITAQIESIRACWPELVTIFPIHHAELALFQDRMPLAPQHDEYFRREQNGQLFLATMRWDGRIAAYQITNVAPGFHYGSTLTATQDLVYVHPEMRHKGLAFPLFRLVRRELERRGVKIWHVGYKSAKPLGLDRLLPILGFTPGDTYLSRWIDNDNEPASIPRI
jgi:GNAT superfamily N-acetyltransferase